MPSTEATLAWALKVDIETLGPHLEAYANLLPVINTLRLSNRFGQGSHATIAKLPAELINNIENHMIKAERKKLTLEWNKDYRCYRMYCDPDDHVTKEQYDEYLEKAEADETVGESLIDIELEPEERVNIQLGREFEVWAETHFEHTMSWQLRVGIPSAEKRGIFSDHEGMIMKHFGLRIWVAHERLEDGLEENYWLDSGIEAHDTVAYLMLPSRTIHKYPTLSKSEVEEKEFHVESGYGMPVNLPGPISESARARFKRMMQILDLKPAFEWNKYEMDLFAEEVDVRALRQQDLASRKWKADKAAAMEPKLTMLIKHTVRSDEDE